MAAFRFAQTRKHPQQRRFARPVRTGQKQGVACVKRESDPIENQPFTAENRDIFHFQQGAAGGSKGRNDGNPPIRGDRARGRKKRLLPLSCYRVQLVSQPRPGMFYPRWEIKQVVPDKAANPAPWKWIEGKRSYGTIRC